MSTLGKVIIGGGIIAGIMYLLRLKRVSTELETLIGARIHKFDFSGITVMVDVLLKNPTAGSMYIKAPFVKLMYGGSTIGSSRVVNEDVLIPSYGEKQLPTISLFVPYLSLLTLGSDLIKALVQGVSKGIAVQIKTLTMINGTIPFEKVDEVVLKREG